MRIFFGFLILGFHVCISLKAATENDTNFVLRKPGETPQSPEKITHVEISAYLFEGKAEEYKRDFLELMAQVRGWPNVRTLLISHVDGPEMVAAFKKSLLKLSEKNKLRSLDMRASFGLIPLPEEIFKIRSLEVLAIWDMKIKTFPAAIGELTNLREFYTLGTDEYIVPNEVNKLKKLNKVYLHGIAFSNEEVLKKFAATGSVKELTMVGCDFHITPMIAALFPQLEILMTDGLCSEIDQFRKMKKLKVLSLSCFLDDSLLAELNKALPGCTVYHSQEFCFPADAIVNTNCGDKKISNIIPGSIVTTMDPKTGRLDTAKVLRVERHPARKYKVLVISVWVQQSFASAHSAPTLITLRVTLNHPIIMADGSVIKAENLTVADQLICTDLSGAMQPGFVTRIESVIAETELYNLVTTRHTYTVEGVLVSDKY
jgi:hypothetical protein